MVDLAAYAQQLLGAEQIGWLTTVSDAQPQSSPVWFLFEDSSVWIRSQPTAAKLRNISRNDRVAFHLDTRHGGHVVTIEARSTLVAGLPDTVREAYRAKYHHAIVEELHSDVVAFEASYSVIVQLTPTRVRGW